MGFVVGLSLMLLAVGSALAHVQPPNVRGITIAPSDDREREGYRVTAQLPSGKAGSRSYSLPYSALTTAPI
jgi:hypothetical protein